MTPLDILPVIDEFNVGPLTRRRYTASVKNQYGETEAPAAATAAIPVIAAFPTSKRDLSWASEALRANDWATFVTPTEIRADQSGALPDEIEYNGFVWRIMGLADLALQGAAYVGYGMAVERLAP